LHSDKRYELAVIRIQTACEMDTLATYNRLQCAGQQALKHLRFAPSLMDKQSRALLELVSGRRIQDEPWWEEYCTHVKRRNRIVHEGLEVDRNGAVASLEVALQLQRWLLDASS
jgi:hypothetical protein